MFKELRGAMQTNIFKTMSLAACVFIATSAQAITYDESVDGDLSGSPATPTMLALDPGANTVSGTTVGGDFDLLHISVPAALESVVLSGYVSLDNLGFMGVQSGTTWTEGLGGAINPANLLGWSHFGPGNGTVGTDILDDIGAGPGALGFIPPLPSGDYTILIQQTGGAPIDYTFSFTVAGNAANTIPEPLTATLSLMSLGVLGMATRRRVA